MDRKRPREEDGPWASQPTGSDPSKRHKVAEPNIDATPIPMEGPYGRGFFLREDVLAGLMGEVQQHMETIRVLKTEFEQIALKSVDTRRFYEEQFTAAQKQVELAQSISQQTTQLNVVLEGRVTSLQARLRVVEAERDEWKNQAVTLQALHTPLSFPSASVTSTDLPGPSVVPIPSSSVPKSNSTRATPYVTYPPSPDRNKTTSTSSELSLLTLDDQKVKSSPKQTLSRTEMLELGPIVHEKRIYFQSHPMLTNDDIVEFIKDSGLSRFDIVRKMFNDRSGRALIQFQSTEDARRLLRKHGDRCHGFEARITLWHQRVPEPPKGCRTISATFSDEFPASEEAVRHVLRDCGPIEEVKLIYSMPGNHFQHKAIVQFRYEISVERALRLHEARVLNSPMRIDTTANLTP